MKVAKWGNSLAIRLPAGLVEALKIKEGDDIEVEVAGKRQLDVRRKEDVRAMLIRLRKYRGRIPADFKFDRLEANERG
jgi:antitoxin MazE